MTHYICPGCGGPRECREVDTTSLGSIFDTHVNGRIERCRRCGDSGQPFELHRYSPPLPYAEFPAPAATWTSDDAEVAEVRYVVGLIHCGPPAHLPAVPTPADILRHADGLGRVLLTEVP
jgi:hypothetical protein